MEALREKQGVANRVVVEVVCCSRGRELGQLVLVVGHLGEECGEIYERAGVLWVWEKVDVHWVGDVGGVVAREGYWGQAKVMVAR